MATVSNAFSGSTMSNTQAGTRLTSSSDWTRLKKLKALGQAGWNAGTPGKNNPRKNQGTPFAQNTYSKPMLIPKHMGASKYQNMASDWTSLKAYNTADYVVQGQQTGNVGKTLVARKLCTCVAVPYSPLKRGLCAKCNGTSNKAGDANERYTH
jgi:hypothetical protein